MAVFGLVFFFYIGNISTSWVAQPAISQVSPLGIDVAFSSVRAPLNEEINQTNYRKVFIKNLIL